MDNEVYSESLAFPQVKKRAVSSRSYRVKIPPSNGSSFLSGQTIQVDLPGNQAATYYNMNQMYLKFKVKFPEAAILNSNGAYNFIKRLTIVTAGSTICDIQNYNVLTSAFLDTQASREWKASSGNILCGMYGDSLRGEAHGANDERIFCIPIVLNVLSSTTPHRLIPAFSLSSLQIRFELELPKAAYYGPGTLNYAVSEVELVTMMTQLSSSAQAEIDKITNGQYNILAVNYMNSNTSQSAGASVVTANLGFSMSSLERIIVVHRKTDAAVGTANIYSTSRFQNGLSEFSFLINSEQYPARPILVDNKNGAETWAESLISDHALVNFKQGASINIGLAAVGVLGVGTSDLSGVAPDVAKRQSFVLTKAQATGASSGAAAVSGTAATASSVGTFVASCEFESSISDGKSSSIYSGISTIASALSYRGVYANEVPEAAQIDFFACYTVLLSLDMRGLGVFQMRV